MSPGSTFATSAPVRGHRLAAAVAALSLLATWGLDWLPVILVDGSFARMNTLGIGPFVVGCNVVALVLVVALQRGRGVLTVWLAVAMLAATLDTAMTVYGAGRFTLGWYAARCLSLATGIVVLGALLSELCVLFARTAHANRELIVLSLTDALTAIPNRRAFERALAGEWRRARREQTPVSLLAIDVDLFKGLNDRYGHARGDECLRRIARALHGEARRAGDVAGRTGGEEFAMLLPQTEEDGAARVADLVHAAVANLELEHAASPLGCVTVSIGLATRYPGPAEPTPDALIEAADQALYRAKREGRNRTCVASYALADPGNRAISPSAAAGARSFAPEITKA